jgi:hypothetical protein
MSVELETNFPSVDIVRGFAGASESVCLRTNFELAEHGTDLFYFPTPGCGRIKTEDVLFYGAPPCQLYPKV